MINLWNGALYGVFGFIVSAVFVGAWMIVAMLVGVLSAFFGGREDDDDEGGDI